MKTLTSSRVYAHLHIEIVLGEVLFHLVLVDGDDGAEHDDSPDVEEHCANGGHGCNHETLAAQARRKSRVGKYQAGARLLLDRGAKVTRGSAVFGPVSLVAVLEACAYLRPTTLGA